MAVPNSWPKPADMVVIGQVGGPYGVRGWVHVLSFTEPPAGLLGYAPWHLRLKREAGAWGTWRRHDREAAKAHGEGFVASFGRIGDRNAALRLAGAEIGVTADRLPPLSEDEFYWRDLIGLRVLNQHGEALGEVRRLMSNGAQDVLVVGGDAETLIPFVSAHVAEVRLQEGCIHVHWEGLD